MSDYLLIGEFKPMQPISESAEVIQEKQNVTSKEGLSSRISTMYAYMIKKVLLNKK